MDPYPDVVSCLSSDPHDDDISDPVLHCLGCLRFDERKSFFDMSHPFWQDEISDESTNLHLRDPSNAVRETVQERLQNWKRAVDSKLERLGRLRKAIEGDEEYRHLVKDLSVSKAAWQNYCAINVGKKRIQVRQQRQQERTAGAAPSGGMTDTTKAKQNPQPDSHMYDPDDDSTAYVIEFDSHGGGQSATASHQALHQRRVREHSISVQALLYPEAGNPGSPVHVKGKLSGNIRWIHLPSNNMAWAEEAVKMCFGQNQESRDSAPIRRHTRNANKSVPSQALVPEVWQAKPPERSDLRGSRSLRQTCKLVTSGDSSGRPISSSITLYAPFLSWEIYRRQSVISQMIEVNLFDHKIRAKRQERDRRMDRIARRTTDLARPRSRQSRLESKRPLAGLEEGRPRRARSELHTVVDVVGQVLGGAWRSWYAMVDNNGVLRVHSRLGQYLVDCARMYEAMMAYRDRKLIERYMTADKPLHPRRTLHRALTPSGMGNWNSRKREQVVYRWTSPKPSDLHHFDPWHEAWPTHEEMGSEPCETCTQNIRMLPKILVVDQLWMWILNEDTIITCFPNRYGAEDDNGGLYKAIRSRLQETNDTESVFSAALTIVDECSNHLFEPRVEAKARDQNPPVLEAFDVAIKVLRQKQALSREKLLQWANYIRMLQTRSSIIRASTQLGPWTMLDINPEGHIQVEIEDIKEELKAILNITDSHERMLLQLTSNVDKVLGLSTRPAHSPSEQENAQIQSKTTQANGKGKEAPPRPVTDEEKRQSFKLGAAEALARIRDRKRQLEDKIKNADELSASAAEVLALKQHTMATAESWRSSVQAASSNRQNTAIVMFTVVTVIFAPLSFMSSVFGMNAAEFANNSWSLGEQFSLLFPLSFAVTALTIVVAFSARVQTVCLLVYRLLSTVLLYRTGLYRVWVLTGVSTARIAAWAYTAVGSTRDRENEKILLKRQRQRAARRLALRDDFLAQRDAAAVGDGEESAQRTVADRNSDGVTEKAPVKGGEQTAAAATVTAAPAVPGATGSADQVVTGRADNNV
ncbi:hypothetical protein B0T26DRAFT_699517 [Lasiosphaeria miniovina]|uniref:Ankyrin repeat protein n=1 Tax=Lasiosphaeria miniovina TaxID=1954250 RepID=A0AA40E9B8_9PEZI|nr:uncharacterized protein B0T26DRAFT_699517 [Lasiosphaeria miniovina]KAK0728856.1 hypothetical protein B0T26DRAFT_699517 [Lasiosphaeria miniovina]